MVPSSKSMFVHGLEFVTAVPVFLLDRGCEWVSQTSSSSS